MGFVTMECHHLHWNRETHSMVVSSTLCTSIQKKATPEHLQERGAPIWRYFAMPCWMACLLGSIKGYSVWGEYAGCPWYVHYNIPISLNSCVSSSAVCHESSSNSTSLNVSHCKSNFQLTNRVYSLKPLQHNIFSIKTLLCVSVSMNLPWSNKLWYHIWLR